MKKRKIRNLAFEFLSIFIAVVAAFALNNWNDNRKAKHSAHKILYEISEGLDKDLEDVQINVYGHNMGVSSCQFWRDIIMGIPRNQDSIHQYYRTLTRDFVTIQNTSGYETLKSGGLELIENDSLRSSIISLYEFDYAILRKLEEHYTEMQFFDSYYQGFIEIMAPYLKFSETGKVLSVDPTISITNNEKQLLLAYIGKIEQNRRFILKYYGGVIENIELLDNQIEQLID